MPPTGPALDIEPPAAPPPPPPNLQLSGVVLGSDKQLAIVKRMQDVKTTSVEVGSQIDGWTVAAILPRAIVLRHDTRTVTIELRIPAATAGRPASPRSLSEPEL